MPRTSVKKLAIDDADQAVLIVSWHYRRWFTHWMTGLMMADTTKQ